MCLQADQKSSEADKIAHILKGIADGAFNLLVFTNVTTVENILKECRRLEQAKWRRISPLVERLPNTALQRRPARQLLVRNPHQST